MKLSIVSTLALVACLATGGPANASKPQELEWDDLVPAEAEFDDPFTRLDEDQLFELTLVAQIRDQLDAGEQLDANKLKLYHDRIESLQADDIDVEGLLAMRETVARERTAKTLLANQQLDGKQVRMPGYLLPLEYEGKKVTEFLLVPYVGACIHTPPPPPIQIVHVKSRQGFETDGGLYTPVWVSGLMKIRQMRSNLSLVDGSSDITSAYTIDASKVEIYD